MRRKRKVYYFSATEEQLESLPDRINGRAVSEWKQVGAFRSGGKISDDDDARAPFIPIYSRGFIAYLFSLFSKKRNNTPFFFFALLFPYFFLLSRNIAAPLQN